MIFKFRIKIPSRKHKYVKKWASSLIHGLMIAVDSRQARRLQARFAQWTDSTEQKMEL